MQVPANYGTPGGPSGILFHHGKRRRMNAVSVAINIIWPWVMFSVVFAVFSFSLHYTQPTMAMGLLALAALAVLLTALLAHRARKSGRDPMWYTFAAFALLLAVVLAAVLGDMNFYFNMQPFYDIRNLKDYAGVDPARDRGQKLMDAGRVYFDPDARLDFNKAKGYKNTDIYCVVPITSGQATLESYDFWAVGTNCCGIESDFRCGEFNNPHAQNGLRLLRNDQRPFYRLAVQSAEAAYSIKATHPLFFFWMQDPLAEMDSYRSNGYRFYLLGIFMHFAFNLLCVVCAVFGFSKMGRY